MNKQIVWSPRAESDFINIIEYLIGKFGSSSAIKFANKLDRILNNIAKLPEIYPVTVKRKNVRRCVISRQTTLYYRVKHDTIQLVTFYDTRQHPDKINLS